MATCRQSKEVWKFHKSDNHLGQISCGDRVICDFGGGTKWEQWEGDPPSEEDLRLILAAPQLFAALKESTEALEGEANNLYGEELDSSAERLLTVAMLNRALMAMISGEVTSYVE